jgi:hypothetical protein
VRKAIGASTSSDRRLNVIRGVDVSEPALAAGIGDPRNLVWHGVRLFSLAEVLRLVHASDEPGLDRGDVERAVQAFVAAGVARRNALVSDDPTPEELAAQVEAVLRAVEQSPLPELEWTPIVDLLGEDLVGPMVGASTSSMRRYEAGLRTTPDAVAARLHELAILCAELSGSYNEFGIRRWFRRPRTMLGGDAPIERLVGDWSPDDEPVREVRALVDSLSGGVAT